MNGQGHQLSFVHLVSRLPQPCRGTNIELHLSHGAAQSGPTTHVAPCTSFSEHATKHKGSDLCWMFSEAACLHTATGRGRQVCSTTKGKGGQFSNCEGISANSVCVSEGYPHEKVGT